MTNQPSKPPVLPLLSTESPETIERTLRQLRKALPGETIGLVDDFSAAQLATVDVAVAANPTAEMLDALPNLVWLQSLWAGVENLLTPATQRGFAVVRLVDPALADSMAEAALAWTLYLHRRMPDYLKQQRRKHWHQLPWKTPAETHVCILGLGELGRACAVRLQANGFNVTGWSTSPKTIAGIDCYHGTNQLPRALAAADILLVLLPLTATTKGLVNNQLFSMLPADSALINFARGAIVDTTDLLAALGTGQLRHAVLDVFTEEPLPAGNPLWTHPDISVLPHIAAPTNPASATMVAASNIETYRQTGQTPQPVDLQRGF